jgi:hypothetical protein
MDETHVAPNLGSSVRTDKALELGPRFFARTTRRARRLDDVDLHTCECPVNVARRDPSTAGCFQSRTSAESNARNGADRGFAEANHGR